MTTMKTVKTAREKGRYRLELSSYTETLIARAITVRAERDVNDQAHSLWLKLHDEIELTERLIGHLVVSDMDGVNLAGEASH